MGIRDVVISVLLFEHILVSFLSRERLECVTNAEQQKREQKYYKEMGSVTSNFDDESITQVKNKEE